MKTRNTLPTLKEKINNFNKFRLKGTTVQEALKNDANFNKLLREENDKSKKTLNQVYGIK